VHDIADLERRGIVGAFVASTEFIDAAAAQATSLGVEPASIFVPHPIQDRTDDEMRALAEAALDDILRSVTSGKP
jgi:hypothetical protein